MRVWRLCKAAYAESLDGAGNRDRGARWNSPGRGVVYCSATLSLCVLETLVHLPSRRFLPRDLVAVELELPRPPTRRLGPEAYPEGWREGRADTWFRAIGNAWLAAGEELGLGVASVIVPQDSNVLLNPLHSDMARVRIVAVEPFRLDRRLVD